jgi:hypothetical protein
MILPLKIAFIGLLVLGDALRVRIGVDATLRDVMELLDDELCFGLLGAIFTG